jgi:hypothetical protein
MTKNMNLAVVLATALCLNGFVVAAANPTERKESKESKEPTAPVAPTADCCPVKKAQNNAKALKGAQELNKAGLEDVKKHVTTLEKSITEAAKEQAKTKETLEKAQKALAAAPADKHEAALNDFVAASKADAVAQKKIKDLDDKLKEAKDVLAGKVPAAPADKAEAGKTGGFTAGVKAKYADVKDWFFGGSKKEAAGKVLGVAVVTVALYKAAEYGYNWATSETDEDNA